MKTFNKCIIAAVIALMCVFSFSACTKKTPPEATKEESTLTAVYQIPEGVEVIDTITIETESEKKPDVSFELLSEAQEKEGNAVINITQSAIEKDGKEIWLSTATAVKIDDDDFDKQFMELYSAIPKSNDLVYGVGSAKMSTFNMSLTTASTRARAAIARAYGETTVNDGVTVTTSNVTIKNSNVEQFAISPDLKVWITLSAMKEDIEILK